MATESSLCKHTDKLYDIFLIKVRLLNFTPQPLPLPHKKPKTNEHKNSNKTKTIKPPLKTYKKYPKISNQKYNRNKSQSYITSLLQ